MFFLLRYMYTGILDLKDQAVLDILNLLVASDELLIEELVDFVQKYLIENQTEWLKDNFVNVLHTAYQLEGCKKLQNYCLESICEDPKPFFNSPEFLTLEKSILLELIKRDDLSIDEVVLWNYLIKWGIAQTSELKKKSITDINKWNKEDFLALKNTLDSFFIYIRFFDISSRDFHSNIRPFKKVLPKALFENIVSFYLTEIQPENTLPPRHGIIAIDSLIIKPKYATIFANWIQRNDINAKIPRNKYNFNLIYRGSRDGFDVCNMRIKCDGQGECILVIKVKENETIIGGYSPFGWNYYNDPGLHNNPYYYIGTTESFIFSLYDGKDYKKVKISRVTNKNYAIYESYYMNMALNFGNSDLIVKGNRGTCKQSNYESSILDINDFSIEEIEIFKFWYSV
jgi:hypothetical protein